MVTLLHKIFNNKHRLKEIVRNRIRLLISKILKRLRPSSEPFISGDTFRKICKHVFELKTKNFLVENINEGDKVFVELTALKKWFSDFHPKVSSKYILISHNGDEAIDGELVDTIDDKIIKWYSQNVNYIHPKLVPIPIGLENLFYYNNGIPNNFIKYKNNVPTLNKILYGFNIQTNPPERQAAYDSLVNNLLADKISEKWPGPKKYLQIMSQYKFIASPPGNGIDCHRTWEAMYLNVVPIVKRSVLTEYFFNLGLPMWLINDWTELMSFNQDELRAKYVKIMSNFNRNSLSFDYWKKVIDFTKD